ncbi:Hypothetical predicted protein [Mytilus galloprovincialis]|uniref:peptide-methionine (R)-S-oxide reductase n=1 Tax=Mytilus galloprovincialis TaxID=29158 RepID=A0A8B6D5V2_MYTGA|nr:Hypothetical predicted protein [Mytilus galloprovincialis]
MGTGLHGKNGLDPGTAITILYTYVMPILTYGLEILLPSGRILDTIHQFHKKMIKQILSLAKNTADPAVYILSGSLPMEAELHLKALSLYGNITRADRSTIEWRLAERQLHLKTNQTGQNNSNPVQGSFPQNFSILWHNKNMAFTGVLRSVCRVAPIVSRRMVNLQSSSKIWNVSSQCMRVLSTQIDPEDPRTVPNTEWEKRLTPEQYATTREKFTEPPFSGIYVNNYEEGTYNCLCCGNELFR